MAEPSPLPTRIVSSGRRQRRRQVAAAVAALEAYETDRASITSLAGSSDSSAASDAGLAPSRALVAVLDLDANDEAGAASTDSVAAASPASRARRLQQFETAHEALQALETHAASGRVWIDVASTAPDVVARFAEYFDLQPETVQRITHLSVQDSVEAFDYYLELGFCLTIHQSDDDFDQLGNIVMFVFTGEALVSFHNDDCATIRVVMARNRLLPPPAADATASNLALQNMAQRPVAPPVPSLRPDQIVCDVIYYFVRDCAAAMQRSDDIVEELHELMLVFQDSERSDFLRRLADNRMALTSMRRQLAAKQGMLRNLLIAPPTEFIGPDALAHLNFILEQINYYVRATAAEKDSINQVQANYLAKVNVEMADVAQNTNDAVTVFSIVGTIFLPVNMVSALLGMNVWYPNRVEETDNIGPFLTSLAVMVGMMAILALVMWRMGLF